MESPPPWTGAEATGSIFVVNYGWHTGIALRKADIAQSILPEVRDFPDAEFLEFGWGDWDYYQAADAGVGMALKAAFWSSRSVLHAIGFKGTVQEYFQGGEVVELALSEEGLEQLVLFLADTFERGGPGLPAPASPGLYVNSRFYPAKGKFHIFRNCNTWVAEALQSAGFPVNPSSAITARNVIEQAKRFNIGTNRTVTR
ncbi:MAG: DUF2459 domain-containing protein [Deltaproteobacteria bacterium]|nr:DUF2459 domain-containing protein [Deltaproteobacteria bacterium]